MAKKIKNEESLFIGNRLLLRGHDLMNTINYMSQDWGRSEIFKETQFLGFIPIFGHNNFGVDVNGVSYAAVHIFKTENGHHWHDDPKDTGGLSRSQPWVLMFYGCDNSSYFMRFNTREKAIKHLTYLDIFDPDGKDVMYYNS